MMKFRVEHIRKRYGKKIVLQDICFEAEGGQCVGILGANGCGKSTLLSVLAGVQRADGGSWNIENENSRLCEKAGRRLIGYVPQGNPLMEELTAKDNLRLWYCDSPLDMAEELKTGVLAMLGIPDFLNVPVHKMSGGMKKRLSIACSVAHEPGILIMDEPGAALDLICKERIHNYMKDFRARGGIILLATHEEQEINMCDSLYILKDGRLCPFEYDSNIHRLAGLLV